MSDRQAKESLVKGTTMPVQPIHWSPFTGHPSFVVEQLTGSEEPLQGLDDRLAQRKGEPEERDAIVQAGVWHACPSIRNVDEPIADVQGPLGCENPRTAGSAPDHKIELPRLLRHAATEICPNRTSATFDIGSQLIEAGEGVLQFWRGADSISRLRFGGLERQ